MDHNEPIRQRFGWRIRGQEIPLGSRTLLCAVLRLGGDGPESFYSGDSFDANAVLAEAERLADLGADLFELTAHTAQPNPDLIASPDELRRIVPALRKLKPRLGLPLLVETYHPESAERVLGLGCDIIHDPSALAFSPKMAPLINQQGAGLVLGHMRGAPGNWDRNAAPIHFAELVAGELEAAVARARQTGMDARQVVVDPGLGIGKRGDENFLILDRLDLLLHLNRPLSIGLARQHFLTETVRAEDADWRAACSMVATLAIYQGAHLIRADEPDSILRVARVADRLHDALEADD